MRSNVERNFLTPSSSGDPIVSCHLLWWGVKSNYPGTPYNAIVRANVVTSPYNPVVLAQTFDAQAGCGQGFTSWGRPDLWGRT